MLFNQTLFADDLIYLPLAQIDECVIPPRHPIDFNFICHVVGADSLFLGRGAFLLYISLIAVILFFTLISFKLSRTLAFFASASIFAGIPFLSQGTFITGSYPVHGLFFLVSALYLTSRCLTQQDTLKVTLLCYSGIFLLFILTGIAATSLTLSSFIIAPCALYAFARKRKFMLWALVSMLPALSFTALQFSGTFSNHYSGLSGWIDLSANQLLNQLGMHKTSIVNSMGNWGLFGIIATLAIAAALYIYHSIQLVMGRQTVQQSSVILPNNEKLIILIGIALAGFATSLLPTLFVHGSSPRYTAAPFFFVFCLFFILIQLMINRFPGRFITAGGTIVALIVATLSIQAFMQQHYARYHKASVDQKAVKDLLSQKSAQFASNAQILIFFEDNHTNFTGGYNHWSTHFARMATGRTDITAVIGRKSDMIHDPFTGEYSNHGKQYWTAVNGRTLRKKMVGLDTSRPIHILSLNDQKNTTYNCIAIYEQDRLRIYDADESGARIKYRYSENDEIPPMSNCIVYLLNTGELPAAPAPNGASRVFDGKTSEIISPPSDGKALPYALNFSFKSDSKGEISRDYTETNPPMPLLAPPLSVYQVTRDRFNIGINCDEQTGFSFKSVSDWTRLSFQVDRRGQGILRINNRLVKIVENCLAPDRILLGKGFKSRFWKGNIADFEYRSNGQLIH